MKIYKDKSFLVFDFENGQTVKYDFATKICIGKSGRVVQDLRSQLSDLTINQLCDYCTDKQYGKFLRFVKSQGSYYGREISNIGSILNRVPDFANYEQIFSAGFEKVDSNLTCSINDIPKSLIRLCKSREIILTNSFLKYYKANPDAYLLAYNLEYTSLTDKDIHSILSYSHNIKEYYGAQDWQYRTVYVAMFNDLIKEYGYTTKSLMLYIDHLKTYEAIDDVNYLLRELHDYVSMMKKISPKFDKYPRHFLTTHKIACRNFNRLKQQFDEDMFKSRIDKGMEKTFGDYCFIYPECTQDIKDEAVQQNNCVASYVQRVINGQCHILFLRKKDEPDKSLVTIEVRQGKIVQALQRFDHPLNGEQQEAVDKWNKWYSKKYESEEFKNAG